MDQDERKRLIQHHYGQIRHSHDEIRRLTDECKHRFAPLTAEELADEWMSVGAFCDDCQTDFGWRCKVAPDGVCHYHIDDGKVELVDGTKVDPPINPNMDNGDCIYCGSPDERK